MDLTGSVLEVFATLFSIYALSDILPKPHLELWRQFVLACSFICSAMISETRALLAHCYLLNFFKFRTIIWQPQSDSKHASAHTPCGLYLWLLSFERYNGIVGDYGANQRSVEKNCHCLASFMNILNLSWTDLFPDRQEAYKNTL